MTDEEKAEIALGLKFQCKDCREVFPLRKMYRAKGMSKLCKMCVLNIFIEKLTKKFKND